MRVPACLVLALTWLLPAAAAAGSDLTTLLQQARHKLDGVERGIRLLDQTLEGCERLDDRKRQVDALSAAELDLLLERPAIAAESLAKLVEQPSLADTPQRSRALALLARARAAVGDPSGVQATIGRLLAEPGYEPAEPEFSELFQLWLDAAERSGELRGFERILALHRALRTGPAGAGPGRVSGSSASLSMALARVQLWRGDWAGALEALAERPARHGNLALARYFTGAALAGLGRLEDAAAAFTESAFLYERERGDPEGANLATLQRARVLADLGWYVRAAEIYRSLSAEPGVGLSATRELALMRLLQDRADLGVEELDAILEQTPGHAGHAEFGLVAGELYVLAGAEERADAVLLEAERVEAARRDVLGGFLQQPDAGDRAAAFFRSRGSCLLAADPDAAPPAPVLAALERVENPAAIVSILDRLTTADEDLRQAEAMASLLERRAPGQVSAEQFPLLATGRRYGEFLAGVVERLHQEIQRMRREVEIRGPGFCPAAMRPAVRVAGSLESLPVVFSSIPPSDRSDWQGVTTKKYQQVFRGGATTPGASRAGGMRKRLSATALVATGAGSPCLVAVQRLEQRAAELREVVAERNSRLEAELEQRRAELLTGLEREIVELRQAREELDRVLREGEALLLETVGSAISDARDRAHLLARSAEIAYRDRPWRSLLRLEGIEVELRGRYKAEIEQLRRDWSEAGR